MTPGERRWPERPQPEGRTADAAALAELGVGLGQGWLFDRATTPEALHPAYALRPAETFTATVG